MTARRAPSARRTSRIGNRSNVETFMKGNPLRWIAASFAAGRRGYLALRRRIRTISGRQFQRKYMALVPHAPRHIHFRRGSLNQSAQITGANARRRPMGGERAMPGRHAYGPKAPNQCGPWGVRRCATIGLWLSKSLNIPSGAASSAPRMSLEPSHKSPTPTTHKQGDLPSVEGADS